MRDIRIYIEVSFWKLLTFFKFYQSTNPIPLDTPYCYLPDVEKNKKAKDFSTYYIKPCKYYRKLRNGKSGCTYVGHLGYDILLDDQCKICGEKEDY